MVKECPKLRKRNCHIHSSSGSSLDLAFSPPEFLNTVAGEAEAEVALPAAADNCLWTWWRPLALDLVPGEEWALATSKSAW